MRLAERRARSFSGPVMRSIDRGWFGAARLRERVVCKGVGIGAWGFRRGLRG